MPSQAEQASREMDDVEPQQGFGQLEHDHPSGRGEHKDADFCAETGYPPANVHFVSLVGKLRHGNASIGTEDACRNAKLQNAAAASEWGHREAPYRSLAGQPVDAAGPALLPLCLWRYRVDHEAALEWTQRDGDRAHTSKVCSGPRRPANRPKRGALDAHFHRVRLAMLQA